MNAARGIAFGRENASNKPRGNALHLSSTSSPPRMSSPPPERPRLRTSDSHLAPLTRAAALISTPSDSAASPQSLLPSPFPSSYPSSSTRPAATRTPSHTTTNSLSTPPTPFLQSPHSRRLLLPTVRPTRHPTAPASPKLLPLKSSPSRLSRSRASSVSPQVGIVNDPSVSLPTNYDWIGGGCRFEIVEDQFELAGYQLYAVEKWIVERTRPTTVLSVFTADPQHRVTVTAFSPLSTLSTDQAQDEWDKAMHQLRRDGARPKETKKGVIMVTSLAGFRSDYTIVHIPSGNFLEIREKLYTNINVLRMGCSGRSALTLEEPSDTTKERFLSMYQIPDKVLARSQVLFRPVVLELVKLLQASLAICGMFDVSHEERNGLLCDVTCDGIQRWIAEIGEPCMGVEPMERVVDPTLVAAQFSMILSTRNKLHALGYVIPKDPFLEPLVLIKALTAFQSATKANTHSHSLSLSHHSSSQSTPHPSSLTLPATSSISLQQPTCQTTYLSQPIIQAIQVAYDKLKQNESFKVHKVLINKLDDLATDLRTTTNTNNLESGARGGKGGWWTSMTNNPTTDLGTFVRLVVLGGSSKESASSLRYLWTGRPEEVDKKRKEKEVQSEGEEREREEKERESRERFSLEREVKSSEDEGEYVGGRPWSGRVQKRLETWAVLGRTKKVSVDLGSKKLEFPAQGTPSTAHPEVPSLVISKYQGDEDEVLSSGQISPVSDSQPQNLMLGLGNFSAAKLSTSELSEYDRRVVEFNQKRPTKKSQYQSRINSWSDPVTARDLLDEPGSSKTLDPTGLQTGYSGSTFDNAISLISESEELHTVRQTRLRGRRSFDDAERLRDVVRVLPIERMRIDVELCGQLLIMRRREQHLSNVLACLQTLTRTLTSTNTSLKRDFKDNQGLLAELQARTSVLQDIESAKVQANAMTQETNALAYEYEQFHVEDLWHMASAPRAKVFALREKVFGTGRRLRQGAHGAHGQFNRVQWRVDGSEVLVDALGRTESEVEEEMDLPGAHPILEEAEEEGEIVENPSLRPTWLLNVFNYWGRRWGIPRGLGHRGGDSLSGATAVSDGVEDSTTEGEGQSSSVERPSSANAARKVRNITA